MAETCATCQRPAREPVAFDFGAQGEPAIVIKFCRDCARKPSCHFYAFVAKTGRVPEENKGLMNKARQRGWMTLKPNEAKAWIQPPQEQDDA